MSQSNYYDLPVAAVIQETHDACSFEFDVPEPIQSDFQYRPGQFLTLRIPWKDDWLPRCYSLSSSPYEAERLRVTVKRVDDGRGSNWLCDTIKAGDVVQVLKPAGVFVPKDLNQDFL
ncbi:MAG: FAD-binding oxidoreductase, partial [Marinobacter sp.]